MSRTIRMTQQEVDPLGGIAAVPLVAAGAVGATAIAIGLTWWHRAEIGSVAAAVLAIVMVAAAGAVAWVSALPSRGPFTLERLGLIVLLGLGGAVAEYVSTVGKDQYLYDNFGPIVVGLLLLSVAPFCSWVALLVAGAFSAAVVAVIAVGSAEPAVTDAPWVSFAIVSAVAVLAPAAAGAAYSASVVNETLALQRRANAAALERDTEVRTGIARLVQQSRVSVLSREVLPFLAHVMTVDRITVDEADRARELAEALRRALKAGIESTWLDELAFSLTETRGVPVEVRDADAAAAGLGDEQRAALTALVVWLADERRSSRIAVELSPRDARLPRIVVSARRGDQPFVRRDIERFTVVARSVGLRGEVAASGENVRVEFRHDT
jgi:hypothetical protein